MDDTNPNLSPVTQNKHQTESAMERENAMESRELVIPDETSPPTSSPLAQDQAPAWFVNFDSTFKRQVKMPY